VLRLVENFNAVTSLFLSWVPV